MNIVTKYQALDKFLSTLEKHIEHILMSEHDDKYSLAWHFCIDTLKHNDSFFDDTMFERKEIFNVIDSGYQDEICDMRNNIERMRTKIQLIISNADE